MFPKLFHLISYSDHDSHMPTISDSGDPEETDPAEPVPTPGAAKKRFLRNPAHPNRRML
jgi:hypothetical protein